MPKAGTRRSAPSAAPNFPLIARPSRQKVYPEFPGVQGKYAAGQTPGSRRKGAQPPTAAPPVPVPLDCPNVAMREAAIQLSVAGRAGGLRHVLLRCIRLLLLLLERGRRVRVGLNLRAGDGSGCRGGGGRHAVLPLIFRQRLHSVFHLFLERV